MYLTPTSNTFAITLPDGMLSFITDHQGTDTNHYPVRETDNTLGYDLHKIEGMFHAMLEKYSEDDMWFDVEVKAGTDMNEFMQAVASVLNAHLLLWGWDGELLNPTFEMEENTNV